MSKSAVAVAPDREAGLLLYWKLTDYTGIVDRLFGPGYAPVRAAVIQKITGLPTSKTKAGWNKFRDLMMVTLGAQGGCSAAVDDDIAKKTLIHFGKGPLPEAERPTGPIQLLMKRKDGGGYQASYEVRGVKHEHIGKSQFDLIRWAAQHAGLEIEQVKLVLDPNEPSFWQ